MPDSKLPVVLVAQLAICAFIRGAHRYKFIKSYNYRQKIYNALRKSRVRIIWRGIIV